MSGDMVPPVRRPPAESWEYYTLWQSVLVAIREIPQRFRSTISVSGIRATEVYAFSEVLGVTIEAEVVRTLNELRKIWDSDHRYTDYRFVRQPQTFPDVLLQHRSSSEIVMGIELKSWYLLAKEGEPSFRFTVTPSACAEQDLIVVVPWVLSNVLAGSPIVFEPYIELARYVAEYRNDWWQHTRSSSLNTQIISPADVAPYPEARDEISDKPVDDKGKNFGRIARLGIMDEYVTTFDQVDLLGIEVARWRQFFKERTG
jgi:hypothetical protein